MKKYQNMIKAGIFLMCMVSCIMGLHMTVKASEIELQEFEMSGFKYVEKSVVVVEKGVEDFYIPEYCHAYDKNGETVELYAGMSEMSYQSSNEEVASVEPSGRVVAKSVGSTTISAAIYGKTDSVQLEVIEDMETYADKIYSKEYERKAYEGIEKTIKQFFSTWQEGEKITWENPERAYQLTNLMDRIYTLEYGCDVKGYVFDKGTEPVQMILAYPIITHYECVVDHGAVYDIDNEILFSGKKNQIKNITGKGRTVTITLKKAVTEKMIFCSQYAWSGAYIDSNIKRTNVLKIPAYVIDNKTGHSYKAEAVIRKGSKKIVFKTKKLRMKKGRSYRVEILRRDYSRREQCDWLNSKGKFKAK